MLQAVSHYMQYKLQATTSAFPLHSPPVCLCAALLWFELEAGDLHNVEEAVAHHARNSIIHSEEAFSKPGEKHITRSH